MPNNIPKELLEKEKYIKTILLLPFVKIDRKWNVALTNYTSGLGSDPCFKLLTLKRKKNQF